MVSVDSTLMDGMLLYWIFPDIFVLVNELRHWVNANLQVDQDYYLLVGPNESM